MDRDIAKLRNISQDLSELGLQLSNRDTPIDGDCYVKIGEAFVAVSEAVADISAALQRGAEEARQSHG